MELKSANFLPSSMKAIVLYATEENYQKHCTLFSQQYVYRLHLSAL
jgi:hypothetical protein